MMRATVSERGGRVKVAAPLPALDEPGPFVARLLRRPGEPRPAMTLDVTTPPTRPSAPHPFADAPRLPTVDPFDLRTLVQGEWMELEIGPGRGGFLFERAAAAPGAGLIGLEVRRKWASIVDGRLARHGLGHRARVFAEDAREALARMGPAGVFRRAFFHFPDPWWKKRHRKRLVLADSVVAQLARLLEPAGELFVQTDVEERADEYETLLNASPALLPMGAAPGSARLADNPYGARSPREHRAIAHGLPVYRLRFIRRAG